MGKGHSAPWHDAKAMPDRARDRTGRFSVGPKGRRRTVETSGILVRADAAEAKRALEWYKLNGIKPSRLAHYGTGATVFDSDPDSLTDSARLAGAKAKPESIESVPGRYTISQRHQIGARVTVTERTGAQYAPSKFEPKAVRADKVKPSGNWSPGSGEERDIRYFNVAPAITAADQYRTVSSKGAKGDRIAREMVSASNRQGQERARAAKARISITAEQRKLAAMRKAIVDKGRG